jgi:hypothetical protein
MIHLLLVDDQALIRRGLHSLQKLCTMTRLGIELMKQFNKIFLQYKIRAILISIALDRKLITRETITFVKLTKKTSRHPQKILNKIR